MTDDYKGFGSRLTGNLRFANDSFELKRL
jgi:hypothetical protein